MSGTRAVIAAVAAAFASACGAAPATSTGVGTPSTEVRVGLTEWEITTGATVITNDDSTLVVTNAGTTAHDLRVTAAGDDIAASRRLQPGEQQALTLTTPADIEVKLWCTVPGHRAQGMQTTLTVTRDPRQHQ